MKHVSGRLSIKLKGANKSFGYIFQCGQSTLKTLGIFRPSRIGAFSSIGHIGWYDKVRNNKVRVLISGKDKDTDKCRVPLSFIVLGGCVTSCECHHRGFRLELA